MGGNAFTHASAKDQPTIKIQRLTAVQYQEISHRACQDLHVHFPDAEILIAATFATKESHGDIDILLSTYREVDWSGVVASLGGRAWVDTSCPRSPGCSLALRIDGTRETQGVQYFAKSNRKQQEPTNTTREAYAQIDIRCVPHEELHWHSFYNSYSDTGLILGRMARPFGLKITSNRGLVLRLEELDAFKEAGLTVADSEGLIHLSLSLIEIMKWLRLDPILYERGFWNADELFEWLDYCNFPVAEIAFSTEQDNARYEAQHADRPVFAAFMARRTASQKPLTPSVAAVKRADARERLLLNAIAFFGKQQEYTSKSKALKLKYANAIANQRLREALLEVMDVKDKALARTLRGFRRYTGEEDGLPVVLSQPLQDDHCILSHFLDEQGQSLKLNFIVWAQQHREEMKTLGTKPIPQHLLPH